MSAPLSDGRRAEIREHIARTRRKTACVDDWHHDLARDAEELLAEVERLRAELAEREWSDMLAHQACQNNKHADWWVDSEHNHLCPWCAIEQAEADRDELRAALTAADRVQEVLNAEVVRLRSQLARHLTAWRNASVRARLIRAERNLLRDERYTLRQQLDAATVRAAQASRLRDRAAALAAQRDEATRERDEARAQARAERKQSEREADARERAHARAVYADAVGRDQFVRALAAEAERDRRAAQVQRVRDLHPREQHGDRPAWCGSCIGAYEEPLPYPCPTIRALDTVEENRG